MNQGSHTLDSYATKVLVGTEKTSTRDVSSWVNERSRISLTIDFLQSELLSFADETEDHAPGDEIEACVEAN
jgi:hypothetical protein